MSLTMSYIDQRGHRFPRVSGDEPELIGVAADLAAFSPRERG